MPLIPVYMSTQMRLKGTSKKITGTKFSPFISASSMGICTYILASSLVNSTNNVTGPGAGTFTGRISGLSASSMSKLMRLKAVSFGLVGRDIGKLFDSVSHGVVQALKAVLAQGAVVGGGPGTGQGKVLGLIPTALEPIILANLAGRTIVGSKTRKLVSAISFGICNHIMTAGMVRNTCIGAFAGPPAGPVQLPVAPGVGKLV